MTTIKCIVVFKSKTGFTEKYAHWIAEDLHCDAVCVEKTSISQIGQYDVVIFGGGIHAGTINGIGFIKNNLSAMTNKKIIVFATGAAPAISNEIERYKKTNIPDGEDIAFFYFQSGMNYAKMHRADKLLMGMFKAFLKLKKHKSDVEKGTTDAIGNSYDYSNRDYIAPLIRYVNSIPSTE